MQIKNKLIKFTERQLSKFRVSSGFLRQHVQHACGEEDAGSEAIEKGDRLRFMLLNEADERG